MMARLLRWETMLAAVLVAEFVLFSAVSPYFLSVDTLSDATFNFTERALIALPLALLIIAGEIDISYIGPNPAINGFVQSKGEALRRPGGVQGRRWTTSPAVTTCSCAAPSTTSREP